MMHFPHITGRPTILFKFYFSSNNKYKQRNGSNDISKRLSSVLLRTNCTRCIFMMSVLLFSDTQRAISWFAWKSSFSLNSSLFSWRLPPTQPSQKLCQKLFPRIPFRRWFCWAGHWWKRGRTAFISNVTAFVTWALTSVRDCWKWANSFFLQCFEVSKWNLSSCVVTDHFAQRFVAHPLHSTPHADELASVVRVTWGSCAGYGAIARSSARLSHPPAPSVHCWASLLWSMRPAGSGQLIFAVSASPHTHRIHVCQCVAWIERTRGLHQQFGIDIVSFCQLRPRDHHKTSEELCGVHHVLFQRRSENLRELSLTHNLSSRCFHCVHVELIRTMQLWIMYCGAQRFMYSFHFSYWNEKKSQNEKDQERKKIGKRRGQKRNRVKYQVKKCARKSSLEESEGSENECLLNWLSSRWGSVKNIIHWTGPCVPILVPLLKVLNINVRIYGSINNVCGKKHKCLRLRFSQNGTYTFQTKTIQWSEPGRLKKTRYLSIYVKYAENRPGCRVRRFWTV